MKTLSPTELDQAKLDPGSVFHRPEDVLGAALSTEEKKSILLRWEEDAQELMQATEEGMPPSEEGPSPAEMLRAVQAALETLDRA